MYEKERYALRVREENFKLAAKRREDAVCRAEAHAEVAAVRRSEGYRVTGWANTADMYGASAIKRGGANAVGRGR